MSRTEAGATSASGRSLLRVFPDPGRPCRSDHPQVAYAVVWSENDGTPRAGRLELEGGYVRFVGSPMREVSYADIADVRIDRRPKCRLAGRPTLVIESSSGDSIRVASLDRAGTLHELAERLQAVRPPA